MDIPNTASPAGAAPAPAAAPKNPLIIIASVLAAVAIVIVAAWMLIKPAAAPSTFSLIENGTPTWFAIDGDAVSPALAPEGHLPVQSDLLQEGEFGATYAENGDVVTLSPLGLSTFSDDGARTVLIARSGPDFGSSAIATDASAAALFNPDTNALDVFMLDRTVPGVLTYAGSVGVAGDIYGVGFVAPGRLIVRTSQTDFLLYRFSEAGIVADGTAAMEGTKTSFFEIPVAHAWTYSSAPTSVGATTASGARCTGAQVANMGTASGSGAMPSVQTTVWSYMPTPGNLPSGYNNGTRCIQAVVTVTTGGGDDGPGPGPGKGGGEGVFLWPPRAHAQAQSWTIAYTAHSGTGTAAAADNYALTYAAAPTATLTASPTSINQGSAAALSWSSTNATSCTGTGFSTGNATAGTVSVSPTATVTYSVSCTGSMGNATDSETVTVVPRPNLTAGATTPTSGTTGQSIPFSSTVSNTGVAASGATIASFIIRPAGSQSFTVGTANVGALAAGASQAVTYNHTFQAGGTYEVRVCADYHPNQGGASVVTESNESDNCGAWATVAVAVAPAVPVDITSFSATPNPAGEDDTVTISWSSVGASYCTGVGFSTGNATSGSVQGTISETRQYGLECYSSSFGSGSATTEYGEWWTGGTQTVTMSENLNHNNGQQQYLMDCGAYSSTNVWNRRVVNNNRVGDAGQDLITITCYDVTGATGVVSQPYVRTNYPGGGCPGGCWTETTYARSGSAAGSTNDDGMDTATITVTFEEPECVDGDDNDFDGDIDAADAGCDNDQDDDESDDPVISCNLTSNPSPLTGGVSTTFTWESTNAQQCTGTGFATGGREDGTSPAVMTVPGTPYQLQCTAPGLDPCTRTLTASTPTASIEASPDRVASPGTANISWETDQCASVVVTQNGTTISTAADNPAPGTAVSGITKQTVFKVSCDNGAATDTAIVNMVPRFEEF